MDAKDEQIACLKANIEHLETEQVVLQKRITVLSTQLILTQEELDYERAKLPIS